MVHKMPDVTKFKTDSFWFEKLQNLLIIYTLSYSSNCTQFYTKMATFNKFHEQPLSNINMI